MIRVVLDTNLQTRAWKREKEVIDEIIFRTTNPRNQHLLTRTARGGLRINQGLELTPGGMWRREKSS